jgi:peptidyl-prolyl cis-trans isomerase B (cyclophilin B)
MIQGGELNTSLPSIKGEFTSNGFTNNLRHIRGVISMARNYIPNSATSQFFIMHADGFFLDGNYAAFGKVVEGMDVVDAIAEVETVNNMFIQDLPKEPVVIETIRIVE